MAGFMVLGFVAVIFSFILSLSRFLNCLIILENFKVLLLFTSLIVVSNDNRVVFMTLVVVFTIEVALCLVTLTRLWMTLSTLDFGTSF